MNDKVYWIWLQQVLKYGNNKIRTINLIYESAEDFYNAGPEGWKMCGCFNAKELDTIKKYKLEKAYDILEKCSKLGQKVITIADESYPDRLKQIANPPCVLYVKGDLPKIDDKICISVVGTRSATLYGIQMAFDISLELAQSDVIVISGGALGIDGAAHKGAIQGGGKTVAVLGCGIDYPYLMQNEPIRKIISKSGAVISEFAPSFPAYPANFPMRNRIISGLSLGTVVIEAGKKSGSLITAGLALEQNRDVFAVPVDMNSSVSEGTTALIRDGAKIVTCGEDILCEYRTAYFREKKEEKVLPIIFERPTQETYEQMNGFTLDKARNATTKLQKLKNTLQNEKACKNSKKEPKEDLKQKIQEDENPSENKIKYNINDLSPEGKSVYNILKGGKKHIDALVVETGLPIFKLLPVLTEMEIEGIIESYAGRFYGIA